ncbi:hypothetical protein B0T25DRAFT_536824 [Lasiosphaeria hispida]|uniref:Uncharacterized protein n=1 Tax=Lasiosphaeria hispida TaxID=260671 RepID=A0AAJ0MF92_9PEZI|nr:hypothetical protein B0T25DRAFT_536824 [Lasiosphaeria hispida]
MRHRPDLQHRGRLPCRPVPAPQPATSKVSECLHALKYRVALDLLLCRPRRGTALWASLAPRPTTILPAFSTSSRQTKTTAPHILPTTSTQTSVPPPVDSPPQTHSISLIHQLLHTLRGTTQPKQSTPPATPPSPDSTPTLSTVSHDRSLLPSASPASQSERTSTRANRQRTGEPSASDTLSSEPDPEAGRRKRTGSSEASTTKKIQQC